MTQQAFAGLRILDFTQVLAGPFATQQLAQLGADVIKIEQPGSGDLTRGLMASAPQGMAPSFLTCNIGKRSLTLNLKDPQAIEIVMKIVDTCDAVVENFKPGTMDKLGLGYEVIKARKPDIVYASVSGYGQSGPKSHLPAFDGAIQATSGMVSLTGHPEGEPVRAGYFAVDMSTALNAAFAISAALYRKLATGEGQRVDVAMLDTALTLMAPQMTAYQSQGTLPALLGNQSPTKQPTANVFATADGHIQIVALKYSQIEDLFAALGEQEFLANNPQYADARERVKATTAFNELLERCFASQPSEHWIATLTAAGVPVAPIRNLAEVAEDEQLDERLILKAMDHPGVGSSKVVSATHVADPAPPEVQRPAPTLGQHTDELLAEFGYTQAQIQALREAGVV